MVWQYHSYLFERIFICCKTVKCKRPNDNSIKAEEKPRESSVDITRPTIPVLPKKSSFWSKLSCFAIPEHLTEIKDEETKEKPKITIIEIVETVESPKLRLKGRIFLKDITKVLVYEGDS